MIHRRDDDADLRIATLAELGASTSQPFGIRVFVDEDRSIYINVGRTTDEIVQDRGWTDRHIWMPSHAMAYIQVKHPAVVDPVRAANQLIHQPDYVYIDTLDSGNRIFVVDASALRSINAFASRTTRYVDAIIERRQVENGSLLRLFHLSPRKKLPNGARTWP